MEIKRVNASLQDSYERIFHDAGVQRFMLIFRQQRSAADVLMPRRLERAIGVIYLPGAERISHYFQACLPRQFDAVIHMDITTAVRPLEQAAPFEPEEAETYPTGV